MIGASVLQLGHQVHAGMRHTWKYSLVSDHPSQVMIINHSSRSSSTDVIVVASVRHAPGLITHATSALWVNGYFFCFMTCKWSGLIFVFPVVISMITLLVSGRFELCG